MSANLAKTLLAPIALTITAGVMIASVTVTNAVAAEPPAPTQNVSRVAVENAVQLAIDSATAKR